MPAELTALERAEAVTELVDLVRQRDEAGQLAHPWGRQPHDRGISWASRVLGFTREEIRRSKTIASISAEAKSKAKEHGLDKNQSALLEIATEDAADGQLAKIEEIEIRNIVTRARLRNRRGANQVKAHNKKSKAHTRRSTPKSSASDEPADTTIPATADSQATMPDICSENGTAAELERLKAELAEKTESLHHIESELRQARLAASRGFKGEVTSPQAVPGHLDADDLDIPPFVDRRPLSTEEEETLAALLAVWDRKLKKRVATSTAIIRERFFAAILRTVENAHDGSANTAT